MKKTALKDTLVLVLALFLTGIPLAAHSALVKLALASGQLGDGALGLFEFTLAAAVGAGDSLTINTAGSNFDTEIALYDAGGQMLATNDDISDRNRLSRLRFGATQGLDAGDYTLVVSSFNTIFRSGDIVQGSGRGGDFGLQILTTQPVQTPTLPSYLAMDGNLLPASIHETELGQGLLPAYGIQRFDFVLQDDILGGDWLAIHTSGSTFDTEIGLYDAAGKLVASNDDLDANHRLSRLSFGLDGDNGRSLSAGAYSLLLGGFNTLFGDGLQASSSSTLPGSYAVYLQSSRVISEPSSLWLLVLGLTLLMGGCLVQRKRPVWPPLQGVSFAPNRYQK